MGRSDMSLCNTEGVCLHLGEVGGGVRQREPKIGG